MKWETIKKLRTIKGLLVLCVIVSAIIYKLVTEGLTKENIMMLGLVTAIGILLGVILFILKGKNM